MNTAKKHIESLKVDTKTSKHIKQDGYALEMGIPILIVVAILFFWLRSLLRSKPTKHINPRGYVVINETNELEHHHIAKQILGRNLEPNEVVHHVNGNKIDNRIWNLCLMNNEKHQHFHAWLRWKKEKDGRYPSFRDQKRVLEAEYAGTLLENYRSSEKTKLCPTCNSPMILRFAKKGPSTGKQFWGCSRFPKCKSSIAA